MTLEVVVSPESPIPAGGVIELKLPLGSDVSFSANAFRRTVRC